MASERIANSNPNIPGTSISCNNTTTLKFTRRPSKENAKNDILISEKSAKIKQWVIQRLQDVRFYFFCVTCFENMSHVPIIIIRNRLKLVITSYDTSIIIVN